MNKFENFSNRKNEVISPEQIKRIINLTKRGIKMLGKTDNEKQLAELFGIVSKNIMILNQNELLNDTLLKNLKKGPIDDNDVGLILNGLNQLEGKYGKVEQS